MIHCPMCGGDGYALGVLGKIVHARCRACGWTFEVKAHGSSRGWVAEHRARQLVADAAAATDLFSDDELEQYTQRAHSNPMPLKYFKK